MKITSLLLAVFAFMISNHAIAQAKNFTVNTSASTVAWLGKKVGGEHSGMVSIQSGSLQVSSGKLNGGNFIMDMNSMTCTDIKDAEYNGKLIGHLKAEDFFNTAKFATASLKITKVKYTKANACEITANVNIKGIVKSVSFPATVTVSGATIKAQATINIDRTIFDIKYGSGIIGTAKDKLIDDVFTLTVNLEAEGK